MQKLIKGNILKIIAVMLGIAGAICFFINLNINIVISIFALGGVILFINKIINKNDLENFEKYMEINKALRRNKEEEKKRKKENKKERKKH